MDKPGPSKKRKVKDENRQFQEILTEKYFFVWSHNKVVCLICKNSVAIAKEYNVKRHYETQHPTFTKFTGELRKQKMLSLKRELIGQQTMFIKPIQDSETATEVSYEIYRMIAKRSLPFNDGDFVKECIEIAAKKMCPEATKKFEKIQLNRMTIQRRILSLSGNIAEQLTEKTKIIEFFSLALDESTDISSTAQLLIFIQGVTQDFQVLEELLGMCSLKGQTKGVDVLNVLLDECSKTDLDLSKLSEVTTDGAPSMIGVNSGLVTLLKKHLQEKNINAEDLMQFHCIIHQEALCSKKIEFQNVMKVVVSTVNFIKSRGLNHRQFKQFLDDIESEYGDLLYYTEVRWLSRGLTLERFLNLIEEIGIFLASGCVIDSSPSDHNKLVSAKQLTSTTGYNI
ncbi:general transcription factor II-I repeat domain-containing protein 2-like [Onthophagus taurus]|uniref:general transcription factor II-I repeat domain-containing protein 2-like n=1 Tax=Onthophagus taurus TaxID=166361 RepID=UPI0039BE160B